MILSDEQAEIFFQCWIPLLDYVNKRYRLYPRLYGMTSASPLKPSTAAVIIKKLWEDSAVIDKYLLKQSKELTEEQISLVKGWRRGIYGDFIVERHLRTGSVLIPCGDFENIYIVRGIYSTWKELLHGYPLPLIVRTSLLPFEDVIICDGIVMPYDNCLGKNLADQARQAYREAKNNNLLITEI